jgi:hypothetical protein
MDLSVYLCIMIPLWVVVIYYLFFNEPPKKEITNENGEKIELPKKCPMCKTGTMRDLTPYIPSGTFKCDFCNYIQYDMRWNDGTKLHFGH